MRTAVLTAALLCTFYTQARAIRPVVRQSPSNYINELLPDKKCDGGPQKFAESVVQYYERVMQRRKAPESASNGGQADFNPLDVDCLHTMLSPKHLPHDSSLLDWYIYYLRGYGWGSTPPSLSTDLANPFPEVSYLAGLVFWLAGDFKCAVSSLRIAYQRGIFQAGEALEAIANTNPILISRSESACAASVGLEANNNE